jgi:hypothetical protein
MNKFWITRNGNTVYAIQTSQLYSPARNTMERWAGGGMEILISASGKEQTDLPDLFVALIDGPVSIIRCAKDIEDAHRFFDEEVCLARHK